ncbi:MAG: hypothetical protein Tsb009_08660 [Planctomycetaceae bacterium]
MKRYSPVLTLCCVTLLTAVLTLAMEVPPIQQQVVAGEEIPQSSSPIELTRCRIKLKKQAQLASDRPGILDTIIEREGTRVKKGMIVAQLKADVAEAAYKVADMKAKDDTKIDYAIKARDQAKVEVDRAKKSNLDQPGAVPEIELQRLNLEWEKAKASVKQAQNEKKIAIEQAKEAKAQLDTYKIVAPFDGVVVRKLKTEGEAVRQGDPILEIVNTDTVIVEGYVDYRDRSRLQVGNKAWAELEHFDEQGTAIISAEKETPIPGKIIFIDETVQKVSRKVLIKVEFTNVKKKLLPGLTARMTIAPGTQFQEK